LIYFERFRRSLVLMSFLITDKCVGCQACEIVCPVDAISGVKKELYFIDPKICIDCGACGRACPYDAILDSYGSLAEKMRRTEWPKPVVIDEICSGCKYCVDICPFDCLSMDGDESMPWIQVARLTKPKACVSCYLCESACDKGAIVLMPPENVAPAAAGRFQK
jgi:electron transport complex protein RnfB